MNFTDYRSFLKDEMLRRQSHNPRYSLRAFARDLGLSASHLAEIFSGKHGLSTTSAKKLVESLKLSDQSSSYFLALVASEHGTNELSKEKARKELSKINSKKQFSIDIDTFRFISDWYHLAILSLAELRNFKSCPKSIARRLGITVVEAEKAIERMIRCGLLAEVKNKYVPVKKETVTSQINAQSIRNFHSQMIQKANDSIFDQPSSERDISARVMTISRSDVPRFRAMMREFRDNVAREAERNGEHDDVYALTMQFFSLSKLKD